MFHSTKDACEAIDQDLSFCIDLSKLG